MVKFPGAYDDFDEGKPNLFRHFTNASTTKIITASIKLLNADHLARYMDFGGSEEGLE